MLPNIKVVVSPHLMHALISALQCSIGAQQNALQELQLNLNAWSLAQQQPTPQASPPPADAPAVADPVGGGTE
jgi:hypothetical protein